MSVRRPSRLRRKRLFALVLAVLLLATCGFFALRRLFVLPYREALEREAARFDLPSSLVAGLILAESHFDPNAVSHAGAVGLMQLTPDTYQWLCFKFGHSEGDLADPDTNLYYGCANLALLISEFSDLSTALAAYNAGPARVRDWLSDKRYSEDGRTLTLVPYEETRTHTRRVLLYSTVYQLLYGLD